MPPPLDLEPVSGQKQSGWGEPRGPGRPWEDQDLLDWERPCMAPHEAQQSLTKARAPGWAAAREQAAPSADSDPSGGPLLG